MPASMMHLYTAKLYEPDADILFFVGNIAPDCVQNKEEKDKTHLRGEKQRAKLLCGLAEQLDLHDSFQKGVLLHLFLDYLWDNGALQDFIDGFGSDTWFLPYREDLSKAGLALYRAKDWARQLWLDMEHTSAFDYEKLAQFPAIEIQGFLQRNGSWHRETQMEHSAVFPPALVEQFSHRAAESFARWLTGGCKYDPLADASLSD